MIKIIKIIINFIIYLIKLILSLFKKNKSTQIKKKEITPLQNQKTQPKEKVSSIPSNIDTSNTNKNSNQEKAKTIIYHQEEKKLEEKQVNIYTKIINEELINEIIDKEIEDQAKIIVKKANPEQKKAIKEFKKEIKPKIEIIIENKNIQDKENLKKEIKEIVKIQLEKTPLKKEEKPYIIATTMPPKINNKKEKTPIITSKITTIKKEKKNELKEKIENTPILMVPLKKPDELKIKTKDKIINVANISTLIAAKITTDLVEHDSTKEKKPEEKVPVKEKEETSSLNNQNIRLEKKETPTPQNININTKVDNQNKPPLQKEEPKKEEIITKEKINTKTEIKETIPSPNIPTPPEQPTIIPIIKEEAIEKIQIETKDKDEPTIIKDIKPTPINEKKLPEQQSQQQSIEPKKPEQNKNVKDQNPSKDDAKKEKKQNELIKDTLLISTIFLEKNTTNTINKTTTEMKSNKELEDKEYDKYEQEINNLLNEIENYQIKYEQQLTDKQKKQLNIEKYKLRCAKEQIQYQKEIDIEKEKQDLDAYIKESEINELQKRLKKLHLENEIEINNQLLGKMENIENMSKEQIANIDKKILMRNLEKASLLTEMASIITFPFIRTKYFFYFTLGLIVDNHFNFINAFFKRKINRYKPADLSTLKQGKDALNQALNQTYDNIQKLNIIINEALSKYPELEFDQNFIKYTTTLNHNLNKNYEKLMKKREIMDKYYTKTNKQIKKLIKRGEKVA